MCNPFHGAHERVFFVSLLFLGFLFGFGFCIFSGVIKCMDFKHVWTCYPR